jgi:hypothetical protein
MDILERDEGEPLWAHAPPFQLPLGLTTGHSHRLQPFSMELATPMSVQATLGRNYVWVRGKKFKINYYCDNDLSE